MMASKFHDRPKIWQAIERVAKAAANLIHWAILPCNLAAVQAIRAWILG